MKKYALLLAAFVFFHYPASAQTRKIMHRSHSGQSRSITNDNSEDNFGLSPAQMRAYDSLRRQEDSAKAAVHPKLDTTKKRQPVPKKKPARSKS